MSALIEPQFPYIELEIIQGTPEWHEWRKTIVGASESAAILGLDPWNTAHEKWKEKLGLKDPEPPTERMLRGIELEPKARECYEKMTGIKMTPVVLQSMIYPWMGASLDGISSDRSRGVEIKCLSEKGHAMAKNGEIPRNYYVQVQNLMALTGLCSWDYFSFDGEDEGIIIECTRNNSFIKTIIEKTKEFHGWVENFCSPPQKYIERDDRQWTTLAQKYVDVTSQIKWLEAQEEGLRQELIKLSGGSNTKGGGIKIAKEVRRGSVEYKNIPTIKEMKKSDLELYRKKPTEYWKITQE